MVVFPPSDETPVFGSSHTRKEETYDFLET